MFIINSFHIRKVNLTKAFINVNHYILIIECFKSMSAFVIIGKSMKNLLRFVFL